MSFAIKEHWQKERGKFIGYIILVGMIAVALAAFCVLVYFNFLVKTFVLNSLKVTNQPVQGGVISWETNVCKYTNKPYTTTRILTNTQTGEQDIVPQPNDVKNPVPTGSCVVRDRTSNVPHALTPGTYTLSIHIETTLFRNYNVPSIITSAPFAISGAQ